MLLKNKKVYMETLSVVEGCTISLTNDYADCDVEGVVNINVLANDTNLSSPVVTITTPPQKGIAVVEINGSITYTATTAVELDTDFLVYTVKDGDCIASATVYININSELTPLPTYNAITLHKNNSIVSSCYISGINQVNLYMNRTTFATTTELYNDVHGVYNAPYGYYTNGTIYRLWNGTSFISEGSCG